MRVVIALSLLLPLIAGCRAAPAASSDDGEIESLLLLMAYSQRFFEKLHLAGQAENWELADLYAHELEEVGEAMVEGGYEKNGVRLESLASEAFLPAVEQIEVAIDARDMVAFGSAMASLAATCNSCHAASGYGAVRIIVPEDTGRPYPSQAFAP